MNKNSYCQVYLIRHGQTEWNVVDRLQGHIDEPLNKKGENQALTLKQKLEQIQWSAVFSSDLSRAYKTASIVLGENPMEVVSTPALRERCMGLWEGRLTTELKAWLAVRGIGIDDLPKDEYLPYKWEEGVESYSDVYERAHDFIQSQAMSHLGSSILVSSHGGVLRAFLYHLDFQPKLRWHVANCAYVKLRIDQDGKMSLMSSEGVEPVDNPSTAF